MLDFKSQVQSWKKTFNEGYNGIETGTGEDNCELFKYASKTID